VQSNFKNIHFQHYISISGDIKHNFQLISLKWAKTIKTGFLADNISCIATSNITVLPASSSRDFVQATTGRSMSFSGNEK